MCGIVGAVAKEDVLPILIDGLRRLEYRGYDSAGVALVNSSNALARIRAKGKVNELEKAIKADPVSGHTGIAHTRWATHGRPTDFNAHPHVCRECVAVVHNGIIENHEALREDQKKDGHRFTSDTDTEVIVHAVHDHIEKGCNLLDAVRATVTTLEGAYALGVISNDDANRLVVARRGSPLVIGLGDKGNYIASDVAALLSVTNRFIIMKEGDLAEITSDGVQVYDADGNKVERQHHISELSADAIERGKYRHYMEKEIFEQPQAIQATLEGRIGMRAEREHGHIQIGLTQPTVEHPTAAKLTDRFRPIRIPAAW